jgi:hypothetical protein
VAAVHSQVQGPPDAEIVERRFPHVQEEVFHVWRRGAVEVAWVGYGQRAKQSELVPRATADLHQVCASAAHRTHSSACPARERERDLIGEAVRPRVG